MNPIYIAIPLVLLFGFLLFMSDQYTSLEIVMCLCFVVIIGVIGTQYFLGVNITATLQDIFNKPEVDISIVQEAQNDVPIDSNDDSQPAQFGKKQVYHVNGQFNYANAKAVCKSYNAKLASIEEMMHAYDQGADWCNYGWSDIRWTGWTGAGKPVSVVYANVGGTTAGGAVCVGSVGYEDMSSTGRGPRQVHSTVTSVFLCWTTFGGRLLLIVHSVHFPSEA